MAVIQQKKKQRWCGNERRTKFRAVKYRSDKHSHYHMNKIWALNLKQTRQITYVGKILSFAAFLHHNSIRIYPNNGIINPKKYINSTFSAYSRPKH